MTSPPVIGHVPPATLQLEAGVRDEAADLAPTGRAPLEGRVGDALRFLEDPAFLAPVLVDRHERGLITRLRPVKPQQWLEALPHEAGVEAANPDPLLAAVPTRGKV